MRTRTRGKRRRADETNRRARDPPRLAHLPLEPDRAAERRRRKRRTATSSAVSAGNRAFLRFRDLRDAARREVDQPSISSREGSPQPSPAPRRAGRGPSSRRSRRRPAAESSVYSRSSRGSPSTIRPRRLRPIRRARESPKRSSARRAATYAPEIAAHRVPPSAWRTSQSSQTVRLRASRSRRRRGARARSAAGSRLSARPACRATPRADTLARRRGESEYSAVIHPRPLPFEPARDLLLDHRGAEHPRLPLRPEHRPVRLLEEVDLDRQLAQLVRASPVPGHATASSSASSTCSTSEIGSWRKRTRDAERSGVPVVRKRYVPSRRVVLDPLAREGLRDLARGLLGGEDERHVAAEHALEDRPDDRVVRAAEDHGVDALLLERRRVARTASVVSSPNGSSPSISGTSRGHATGSSDTPASSACTSLRSGRRDGRLGREQADASVPRRLHRGRLGLDTPMTGTSSACWSSGRAADVAELHATTISFTPCARGRRRSRARSGGSRRAAAAAGSRAPSPR